MLETGEINVADFGTNAAFERDFLPIYFPIDRGLNGCRLFVIRRDRVKEFAEINNIRDLRKFTLGVGADWADSGILERAGLKIVTAPKLESLFPMLDAGRFDALPLGLNEAYGLLDHYRSDAPAATLDSHIVLTYPFGRLFFVNRKNVILRDTILTGLIKAFEDGSFQRLFNQNGHIREATASIQNTKRVVIRIDNPDLTDEFRRIPRKFFLNPANLCENNGSL